MTYPTHDASFAYLSGNLELDIRESSIHIAYYIVADFPLRDTFAIVFN